MLNSLLVLAGTSPSLCFKWRAITRGFRPAHAKRIVQLASPGDKTGDSTVVWPDDRKNVDMGTITITTVDPDSASAEKSLAFDPARLTDGIELGDDPLPALRSRVYALSVAHRRSAK